ncbi:MAG: hypothetical protein ABIN18_08035 [Pseudomonadota bacterium]
MTSQARIKTFDNTSEAMLDDYYVGNGREEPESLISSRTSAERKDRYIDFFSERVPPKQEKAKQVGWWVGRVEEVYEDYFTASLEDLRGRLSTAEFDKEEITPSDLNLLAPNVRFSYTVTQMDRSSGREYVSMISLSGPAVWTGKDSDRAKESYEELFPGELFDF